MWVVVERSVLDGSPDAELEELVALAGGQDLPGRPAAVDLLEAVLEDQPLGVAELAGDPREVDDDVVALRDAHANARRLDRPAEQVAVLGDDEKRDALAEVVQVGKEELVEARRPGVEQAEAVPALADLEERLCLPVHQEHVAEDPIGVERVEREQAGRRIEQLVTEDERDVEAAVGNEARQVKAGRLV